MYFWCICAKEGDLHVLLLRHLEGPPNPSHFWWLSIPVTIPPWEGIWEKGWELINLRFLFPFPSNPYVLVSCSCGNKLPQSRWLKTTEIYSLTVLEARRQGVIRATLPPESPSENPPLPLPASGGSAHALALAMSLQPLCGHTVSPSVSKLPLPPGVTLWGYLWWHLGSTQIISRITSLSQNP